MFRDRLGRLGRPRHPPHGTGFRVYATIRSIRSGVDQEKAEAGVGAYSKEHMAKAGLKDCAYLISRLRYMPYAICS
ncbi:conserved protein of unknown function [Nitrospira japonica]|uniref:Uncharacterized protein n=1 Tax=Nitrospira japonica TaxID=1325564 RepID=A0A1W1I5H8_9BACT|nr:conserved protein of unknown function [Nitrospira japonica]